MSIREIPEKIKGFLEDDRWFSILLIILVAAASFGLGRLSANMEENGISIQKTPLRPSTVLEASSYAAISTSSTGGAGFSNTQDTGATQGGYVASKNSDRYHLPWCSGAQRITEANKIWFGSKEEAEKAGYKPAGNCKGL